MPPSGRGRLLAALRIPGIHLALQQAQMRTGILALPADRRVGDAIARLALQRTIFYTPSEWADIGRLWRFFAN